jgi:hypothetical protein
MPSIPKLDLENSLKKTKRPSKVYQKGMSENVEDNEEEISNPFGFSQEIKDLPLLKVEPSPAP